MPETSDLFNIIDHYINDLFAPNDGILKSTMSVSHAAGLPAIAVSPGQGKLIYLLAKMIGAKRILEIGTLGGYSTIWLARALPKDGKLVTLEFEQKHADVALKNIAAAGLSGQIEVVAGSAVETLPAVISRAGEPFDLVFLDADKVNYPIYVPQLMKGVKSGSIILADNVIRRGTVLVPTDDDPSSGAARAFNAMLAADDRLESIVLQQVGIKGHDGLAIARVK